MPVSNSNISVLNTIELCVAIFRGPDAAGWAAIAESGVPELRDSVQHYSGMATKPLDDLAEGLARSLAAEDGFDSLETEFVRLFLAGPGGIPAPPYESCHQGDSPRIMGQPALNMADRLAAAGLVVDLDSNEPPDHLAIELEYLYHLLSTGWSGEDATLTGQGIEFATAMLPWVSRFRDAVAAGDGHPVFLAGADLAVAALKSVSDG